MSNESGDNHISAEDRAVPFISRQYSVTLTDAAGQIDLHHNVKSCVLELRDATSALVWVSKREGGADILPGINEQTTIQASPDPEIDFASSQTNATAEKVIKSMTTGMVLELPQNAEYNRINVVMTGTGTLFADPGAGRKHGES